MFLENQALAHDFDFAIQQKHVIIFNMTKIYNIIGNMTGNSMDAIDLILTGFKGDKMADLRCYSVPYSKQFQRDMEILRQNVANKTKTQILQIPKFHEIHDEYIQTVANAIDKMCQKYGINKNHIDAIGFHGKTLDHNPPSIAIKNKSLPYTLQMGSGQMLANMIQIPVVYDFRSDFIMNGCEGAPLIPTHNAHISVMEGDGIYYNGGNTSNFAIIQNKQIIMASDSGPFNEYPDNFIRANTAFEYDPDGGFGAFGKINIELLRKMFDTCGEFYEMPLPKSGDPQYYNSQKIFEFVNQHKISFFDSVRTMEYFAAYIAAYTLTLVSSAIPEHIFLFGGGWHNPIIKNSFEKIINDKAPIILPEHKTAFAKLKSKLPRKTKIQFSRFAEYMEPRLCADMAYTRLQNKPWDTYDTIKQNKHIISGIIAYPNPRIKITDKINRAAKGWQR